MTEPVIVVVDELRMRYRGATEYAVDGISFVVEQGEIFGFLGPNGAGRRLIGRWVSSPRACRCG
jgi:ABC-type Na+ transport system ATPase subunit NatA